MSMGQDLMSKETPRDLNSLLDRTMFRKYPMSVLENWIAADESDYELLTEPKQMTFEFDVADFTECHHTQWSSNNMVFKRGTESSVDMSVEDVTITSFSRSGVQGTFVVVVFLESFHRIPQKIQRVSTHTQIYIIPYKCHGYHSQIYLTLTPLARTQVHVRITITVRICSSTLFYNINHFEEHECNINTKHRYGTER